jgi:hypothetical protein
MVIILAYFRMVQIHPPAYGIYATSGDSGLTCLDDKD